MMGRQGRRLRASALPWLGAALLWFGLITPMRADQEDRLSRQGRVRRDRLSAERDLRETQALSARLREALASACRAPSDPAAIRQRAVAATAGLALSPFSLSVSGGAGATVEAEGTYGVVAELLRRLGDPSRGGFLRSASLRASGGSWGVSAGVGALETFPRPLVSAREPCPSAPDPVAEASPRPVPGSRRPATDRQASVSASAPMPTPPVLNVAPAPEEPMTLVAFLASEGRPRVSVAIRGEVRVMAVGDQAEGWTCVSIDRDQGAVFTSSSGGRVVLKAPR